MSLGKTMRILKSKRAFLVLFIMMIAASASFALTLSIVLSIQSTASSMLGESPSSRIIVISQENSKTPITGVVPLGLANRLSTLSGVISISPEAIAPSILNGIPVIVRGVDPSKFFQTQSVTILSGTPISINDTGYAMVGEALANRLNLRQGNVISLRGALNPSFVILRIKAVFQTDSPRNSEIVAPLWTAQWLRGLDYNTISVIRIKVNNVQPALDEVRSILKSEPPTPSNQSVSIPIESYLPGGTGFVNLSQFRLQASPSTSSEFLSKTIGLSQGSVWLLSLLVFLSMSFAIFYAYQELILSSRNDLGILRSIGASSKFISSNIVLTLLAISILSSLIGWLLAFMLFQITSLNSIYIGFYAVNPLSSMPIALISSLLIISIEAILSSVYSTQFLSYPNQTQFVPYSEPSPSNLV